MSVSVIVPAYNAAQYIEETLDSIRTQTIQPKEVIVVDDGSTDQTKQLVENYITKYKYPINIYSMPTNKGIGATRQKGVELAKYEHVAFLSSDDVYAPNFIEKCLLQLIPGVATFTSYHRCNSKLQPQIVFEPPKFSRESVIEWALKKNMYINFSTVIFPRNIFNKLHFKESLRHGEDLIFLLDTIISGLKYTLIDEPLLYYRIHNMAGSFVQDPTEFELVWIYLRDRLKVLGISDKVVQECYVVSKQRAFPSFQRKIMSKCYHLLIRKF